MASRPTFIDLNERQTASPPQRDISSPRSGEIPPALSPLDAFALQGRMLAQQLQASTDNGRRMSRLPPLTIANELSKPRPGYFSAPTSAGSRNDNALSPTSASSADTPGTNPAISRPTERPMSRYPFIQTFDDTESIPPRDLKSTIKQVPDIPEQDEEEEEEEQEREVGEDEPSPSTTSELPRVSETDSDAAQTPASELSSNVIMIKDDYVHSPNVSTKIDPISDTSTSDNSKVPVPMPETLRPGNATGALRASPAGPPFTGFLRPDLAMRPPRMDNGDDSDSLPIAGDTSERKLSSSSVISRSRSPFSTASDAPRSSSHGSDRSFQPRASVNFSRPMSRIGKPEPRPSYDSVQSHMLDSPLQRPFWDVVSPNGSLHESPRLPPTPWLDGRSTPSSLTDEDSPKSVILPNGAPSYVYAKYSLPRGRVMSRNSLLVEQFATHKFEWEQPRVVESNLTPIKGEEGEDDSTDSHLEFKGLDLKIPLVGTAPPKAPDLQPPARSQSADDATPAGLAASSNSHIHNTSYPPRSPSSLSLQHKPTPSTDNGKDDKVATPKDSPRPPGPTSRSSFTRTRMPDPAQIADSLKQMTPEGHLAKGIECHENGELQKSTYHLRLAARGGNATAMLLYALACRHGWGMRANQEEGVSWIKRAVESTGLEVADDEGDAYSGRSASESDGRPSDVGSKRVHKAQLALSIYELGVSYMNGWGIGQDKTLALRCFEIAGSWGDGDALAEAGFCYAKGMGCKKDLKKAAGFYRKAERQGVEMAGNSWIYKDKYMPEDDRRARGTEKEKEKEKKPRDKSRTRTIFGGRRRQPADA